MKILDSQVNEFLATCRESKSITDLVKNGSISFKSMGFDSLIFHYIPHLGSKDYKIQKISHIPKEHKNWIFNTFPEHIKVSPRDPFEDIVLKTGQAIWTPDLVAHDAFQTSEQQDFLKVMESYFGAGLIVPVYGPRRSRGIFYLPHQDFATKPNIRGTAFIEYMCSFFHLCYTKLRTIREELANLTPRENEVLQLIPLGLSNREISERLQISVYTVNGYVKQLFEKLDVADRVVVTQRAIALDLIE